MAIYLGEWTGEADQVEALRAFARNFNWEDYDTSDADGVADSVAAELADDVAAAAIGTLRGALCSSAEREQERRDARR